jgi:hypothetical protein
MFDFKGCIDVRRAQPARITSNAIPRRRRKGGKVRRNRPRNRGHRWYRPDLNSEQDRAYLIGRGFTYAVVARGEKRGRVVSAHSSKELADRAAKNFGGKNPAEVVEIATYVLAGDRPNS